MHGHLNEGNSGDLNFGEVLWVLLPWFIFSRQLLKCQLLEFGIINLIDILIVNVVL